MPNHALLMVSAGTPGCVCKSRTGGAGASSLPRATDGCVFVQLPNFLLAAPTLLFGCGAVVSYVRRDAVRALTLGRLGPSWLQAHTRLTLERVMPCYAPVESTERNRTARRSLTKRRPSLRSGYYVDEGFVFVAQLAAMLLIAVIFMHIQVCRPVLYRCYSPCVPHIPRWPLTTSACRWRVCAPLMYGHEKYTHCGTHWRIECSPGSTFGVPRVCCMDS